MDDQVNSDIVIVFVQKHRALDDSKYRHSGKGNSGAQRISSGVGSEGFNARNSRQIGNMGSELSHLVRLSVMGL